ncbi:MAG: hypothetical protein OXQ30_10070 [Boseongicola sp.]|nr:hypothetical protein [Boseongicola sp.]
MIVWPGGTLAETREDLYGFGFEDFYEPSKDRPGLSEMLAIARDKEVAMSIILPTARYSDDIEQLRLDLRDFLSDFLGGAFGEFPPKVTLEIGSEYFANFSGADAAAYGNVANVMIEEIALAMSNPEINTVGLDAEIAVQAGKTFEDDIDIRAALSELSIQNVDALIHHRFAYLPQGIDPRMEELQWILDAWESEMGNAPSLFVSAWNTVTLTRKEVLDDYILFKAQDGTSVDRSDVDLAGRTTTDFEMYWQDALASASYGQAHAAYVLESFHSYAEIGADAMSVYGIDLVHPGRLSWQTDDGTFDFVGAEMLEMIYESVEGTSVVPSQSHYDPKAKATVYAFENDDKFIVFIAAGKSASGEVTLDLNGMGDQFQHVWAERLTGETPDNWMQLFGIPDNLHVDETPESETYAVGIREEFDPDVTSDAVKFALTSPHEVVRLAFAKSDAGWEEISQWAAGVGESLTDGPILPEVVSSGDIGDDTDAEEPALDIELIADAIGTGGAGLLLAVMFFI